MIYCWMQVSQRPERSNFSPRYQRQARKRTREQGVTAQTGESRSETQLLRLAFELDFTFNQCFPFFHGSRVRRRTDRCKSVWMKPNRSCSKPCSGQRRCLRLRPSLPKGLLLSTRYLLSCSLPFCSYIPQKYNQMQLMLNGCSASICCNPFVKLGVFRNMYFLQLGRGATWKL